VEGRSLAELDLEGRYGITDFGLRRDNITTTLPDTSVILQAGDELLIFSTDQKADELARCFSERREP
jgi:Trk K+ transport system NAD-binding subunit